MTPEEMIDMIQLLKHGMNEFLAFLWLFNPGFKSYEKENSYQLLLNMCKV